MSECMLHFGLRPNLWYTFDDRTRAKHKGLRPVWTARGTVRFLSWIVRTVLLCTFFRKSAVVRAEPYGSALSPCILHGFGHLRTNLRTLGGYACVAYVCKVVRYCTVLCGVLRTTLYALWTLAVWLGFYRDTSCGLINKHNNDTAVTRLVHWRNSNKSKQFRIFHTSTINERTLGIEKYSL